MRPPHEILGVPPGASQEDIKRAYKRRSRECHPDHVKGKEKDWHELQEAYRVLAGKDSAKAAVPPQGAGWVVVDVAEVEAVAHRTIDLAEQMATSKVKGITGGGWVGDVLRGVAVSVVSQSGAEARRKLSERLHERTGKKG